MTISLTLNDFYLLLQGAWITIQLTCFAMIIGSIIGLICGVLRAFFPIITWPLAFVLDIFKSIPLLIQFILANSFASILQLDIEIFTIGYVVLGIYASTFCTEAVRSGILAVPVNLRRAARSLGMSYWQDLIYIVFPVALRIALPSWINIVLAVMKDSALVYIISLVELMAMAKSIGDRLNEPLLVFAVAGIIYYVISLVVSRIGAKLEKRWEYD